MNQTNHPPQYYDLTSEDQPENMTSQPSEDPNMVCILQRYRESLEHFVKITALTKSLDKERLILERKRDLIRKTMNRLRLIYGLAKVRQCQKLRKRPPRRFQMLSSSSSSLYSPTGATVAQDLRVGQGQVGLVELQQPAVYWPTTSRQIKSSDSVMFSDMSDSDPRSLIIMDDQELPIDYSIRNERTNCSLERL